ncbi:MAG TPA: hypothetical protein VF743_03890 [Acidimicrobiales bacterium]
MDVTRVPPDDIGPALLRRLTAAVPPEAMRTGRLAREPDGPLEGFLRALSPTHRIALLKAVVRRLPDHRGARSREARRVGELLGATARALYRSRARSWLPLTEDDLCDLLVLSRSHDGYGEVLRAPFDRAREHQRKHGYSAELADAITVFVDNLPPATTITVRELRRSAALLAVLDRRPAPARPHPWWIDEVRASLAAVDGDERRAWERLVLSMSVGERMQMPKNWEPHASSTVEALGDILVLRRLAAWWPDPGRTPQVSFEGSGAQLLKHFVWMLDLLPRKPGERLVCRLAELDWPRRNPPLAILKPAVAYLGTSTSRAATAAHGTLTLAMARGAR